MSRKHLVMEGLLSIEKAWRMTYNIIDSNIAEGEGSSIGYFRGQFKEVAD